MFVAAVVVIVGEQHLIHRICNFDQPERIGSFEVAILFG